MVQPPSISFPLLLILAYKDQENFYFSTNYVIPFTSLPFSKKTWTVTVASSFLSVHFVLKNINLWCYVPCCKIKKKCLSFGVILVLHYEEEVVEKVGCTLIINSRASLT